jgi:hypothetical protein
MRRPDYVARLMVLKNQEDMLDYINIAYYHGSILIPFEAVY